MIKQLALTLGLGLAMLATQAQTVSVKWSDREEYTKATGTFGTFAGGNTKYVYTKYNKNSRKHPDAQVKLTAYDNTTMKQVASVPLIGFKENESDKDKMKGLKYFDQIVFENTINVFWTKYEDGKTQLYAQIFDAKLKSKVKLKKIYEVKAAGKKSSPTLFVLGNKSAGEKIVIGAELPRDKGENVRFEYKILKNDLSFDASNQITLPYATTATTNTLSASYEIADNGFLYTKSYIQMDKEDKKNLKKNESAYYNLLTVINPASGKSTSHALKYENKNLFRVSYIAANGKTKIYGMYSDLLLDKKGNDLHGIFYAEIEDGEPMISTPKFIDFDKVTLAKLFAKDTEDKKKSGLFASKDAKSSDEESLKNDYVIEQVVSLDKDNVVLFASRMNNYSVRECTGSGSSRSCVTKYYCEKSNVTAFKIDNTGKLVWASNMDRKCTYSGWDVYDVELITDNDNMFLTYGNTYTTEENKKTGKEKKKAKGWKDSKFEYAVFNYKTGEYKKQFYVVNKEGTPKKDEKTIGGIYNIENKMFFNYTSYKVKPWAWIGCIAGFACPPLFFLPFSNLGRDFWGYVGTFQPAK
ncbi:MAG: hypothetical protein ABL940_09660 [Bacteroidia bacterium]